MEDLGFRGGIAQAAAVLASTERLTVGIGIMPAAVRNVAFTAMEVATLAQLFPGRLVVRIGHGMPGWLMQLGAWPARPLSFLAAYTEALQALLRGETVTVSDAGVVVDDVRLEPSSVPQVVPPVVLGVRGPKSLAVAGRVADGTVLAEPVTPEYVHAALAQVAPAGRHVVVAYNIASVDDDETRAIDSARPGLEWIGERDWAPHIDPLPFAEEFRALRAQASSREAFAAAMAARWVQQLALAGTPAQVHDRLAELASAGVTSNVLLPVGADPFEALERVGVLAQ